MAELPRRADHVGSLLRPARLSAARQQWKDGSLPVEELRTHHGNELTEDDQWRKLELVVAVADQVWG